MIRIQKRYLYATIPAIIAFIILYAILDFKILIAILLSALFYLAGVFIFKGKDIRIYDSEAIARYHFQLSKLNAYKENIKDKEVKTKITSIVDTCQKLIEYLNTKPTNATNIYNSLDYYLNFATNRITEYMKVEKVKEKTFTENQLILKMNVYLREIDQECSKLYKEVINSKDKAINYEMKIFEKMSDFEDDERSKK